MENRRDPRRDRRAQAPDAAHHKPAAPGLAERIFERAPDGGLARHARPAGPTLIERAAVLCAKPEPPAGGAADAAADPKPDGDTKA